MWIIPNDLTLVKLYNFGVRMLRESYCEVVNITQKSFEDRVFHLMGTFIFCMNKKN